MDGGPAFPSSYNANPGMSLRDYFAAQALASYMTSPAAMDELAKAIALRERKDEKPEAIIHRVLAKRAYALADAMLRERERKSP